MSHPRTPQHIERGFMMNPTPTYTTPMMDTGIGVLPPPTTGCNSSAYPDNRCFGLGPSAVPSSHFLPTDFYSSTAPVELARIRHFDHSQQHQQQQDSFADGEAISIPFRAAMELSKPAVIRTPQTTETTGSSAPLTQSNESHATSRNNNVTLDRRKDDDSDVSSLKCGSIKPVPLPQQKQKLQQQQTQYEQPFVPPKEISFCSKRSIEQPPPAIPDWLRPHRQSHDEALSPPHTPPRAATTPTSTTPINLAENHRLSRPHQLQLSRKAQVLETAVASATTAPGSNAVTNHGNRPTLNRQPSCPELWYDEQQQPLIVNGKPCPHIPKKNCHQGCILLAQASLSSKHVHLQSDLSGTISVGSLVGQSSFHTVPTETSSASQSSSEAAAACWQKHVQAQRSLSLVAADACFSPTPSHIKRASVVRTELKYMLGRVATPLRESFSKTKARAVNLQRSSGCLT